MAERFVVGDSVRLSNVFEVDGTATDPTTVTLVVTDPSGSATTYTYAGSTVTKDSTGTYHRDVTVSSAGVWSWKWVGTGTAADIANGQFEVHALAPATLDTLAVLTLAEAKAAVGIAITDLTADEALTIKVRAVSRRLDQAVGPIVQRTITGETHEGGCDRIWLRHRPVTSITTVTEYSGGTGSTLTAEDYDTLPSDAYAADPCHTGTATFSGRLWRRSGGSPSCFPAGPQAVRVTYVAGRYADTASVDPLFKEAAAVMLKNAWRPNEAAVQNFGEFDVPAQNFPRFGIPNYVRDLLADEWVDTPAFA